ncbi:hypothetical protein ACFC1T_09415 [Kitasatospora sp. NPDC056076]|uniref:hypothetical protein n=1 Tax=Kitasatospora sp. NPDC056076 TaxID=3345703 RepID=UPI0035DB6BA6
MTTPEDQTMTTLTAPELRPAKDFPSDPADLAILVTGAQPLFARDCADTIERWDVQIRSGYIEELELDGDEIGNLTFYRLRHDGDNPMYTAAADESELLEHAVRDVVIHEPVKLATGRYLRYTNQFQGTFATFVSGISINCQDLLILTYIDIEKRWDGFGLEELAIAEAVRKLGSGCCAVLAIGASDDDEHAEKNRRTLSHSGFRTYHGDILVLDPRTSDAQGRLLTQRARLDRMVEQWNARDRDEECSDCG